MAWMTKRLRKAPRDDGARPGDADPGVPGQFEAAMVRAEESNPDGMLSVDGLPEIHYTEALDDGRTLSISPMVESVLGYTQEEWMADPMLWTHLIHPGDRERVEQECWESNRNEQPFETTYRMLTRTGEIKWFRDKAAVVRGSAGQRLCWEGVMIDISSTMTRDPRRA